MTDGTPSRQDGGPTYQEERRLRRIEHLIGILVIILALAALLIHHPAYRFFDVLVGGVIAFAYFRLLTKTMSTAFYTPEEDTGEIQISSRLIMWLTLLTLASVALTLILLIPRLCHPISYLIGFSAMFVAILGEGVYSGMLGNLKP
jgi:hypothetical protein